MGWGSTNEWMRQAFADQFTPDGTGYLFRRNLRGAAYRVTAQERDDFIAEFARTYKRLSRGLIGGLIVVTIVIVGLSVALDIDSHSTLFAIITYGSIITIIAAAVVLQMRAYFAPARALEARLPVTPALSANEARRARFARLTWGRLGTAAVMFLVSAATLASDHDLLHGWNRLWLVLLGASLTLFAGQAFRKWRFERGA